MDRRGRFLNFIFPVSPSLRLSLCGKCFSVRQACSDSEGQLLFRLGRRQSSPHFASAATACRTEQAGLLQQTRTLCSQSSHLSPGLNGRRHHPGPPEPRGDQNSTPTCREDLYGGSEAR
ncbi:hypothetical protein PBY51_018754 [Eleginops maclovinus]|uniref:Uncharacterized protein n=1 Tax=Eleginops maclovinus TaxID=56733 RepID=A0AAN7Y853_ELEMC|nr:hypothetical protein PBY51_018754 [Eleginops maclovinus]